MELAKDVQSSNLNFQQVSQGNKFNSLTPARIESHLPFSVYTPTPVKIINTEKDHLCSPLPINLVNSKLTQLKKLCGKINAMKSYFMDELHSTRVEIITCNNKTKDPASVDVKVVSCKVNRYS